ncbi:MAG: hypothetical protein AAGC55_10370, partial [Myxococcota bacterium]
TDAGGDDAGVTDAGGDDGSTGEACSAETIEELLRVSCATAACHDSDAPSVGLDLLAPEVAGRLSNVESAICAGQIFIVPGDASSSYLLDKVMDAPSCGVRMPIGGAPLSDEEINCLTDWIDGLE